MAQKEVTCQSVIIGLDFGTTYSGIAWALVDGQKNIEVVSTWPDGGNGTSWKVPTTISFCENKSLWGFQTTSSKNVIRGVKLLLDENQEMRYNPSLEAKKILGRLGKTPVDVSAEYLKKLVDHAKDILNRRFGPVANQMNVDFVLTVPAVWSDKAKDATLKAAIKAGISANKVSLLSEPESVALYAVTTLQPNTIKKRDVLVVCDAGGGTVDLISYCVESLSPLSLKEVVEGTGGVCGSMILDERFEESLEELLGHERFEKISPRARAAALRYWQETIKPNFVGNDNDDFEEIEWKISVPGVRDDPSIDLEGGFLQINKSQVRAIFDPVIQEIVYLVQRQIRSVKAAALSVKAIILVGGFGGSEYLYRRLRQANRRILIIQPPDAWQGVVQSSGAVLRGLDGNQIKSRLSRGHYGVSCQHTYDPELHDKSKARWCEYTERWMVTNQIRWFIHKGAPISENDPVRLEFWGIQECDCSGPIIFNDDLLFSDSDTAPMESNGVVKLCKLRSDLSAIPKQLFKKRTNSKGVSFYKINYELVLIPTSAYIYFQLEFNGVSYGSVQAQY